MKKTEIAAVILIGVLVALGSYWALDAIAGDPFKKPESIQYMDPISDKLADPDPELFNRDAINPTVEVTVGKEDEQTGGEAGDSTTDDEGTEETQ